MSAEAAARSTRIEADLLDPPGDERLGQQERDAGARRVDRVGVLDRPSRPGSRSTRSAGSSRSAIALDTSAWPAVPWSFTVATTPASSISRTHATAWSALAPSSHVVTLMHEPFGAAALVERRRRRLERGGLVLQRDHRRLEHRHQPELQRRLRRVARTVVPQADRRVVDLRLRRGRWSCRACCSCCHFRHNLRRPSSAAITTTTVRTKLSTCCPLGGSSPGSVPPASRPTRCRPRR